MLKDLKSGALNILDYLFRGTPGTVEGIPVALKSAITVNLAEKTIRDSTSDSKDERRIGGWTEEATTQETATGTLRESKTTNLPERRTESTIKAPRGVVNLCFSLTNKFFRN